MVAVSQASYAQLQDFRRRMGWRFPWFSANGSRFNEDFGVNIATDGNVQYNYEPYMGSEWELSGLSTFYRDNDGEVYYAYSTYARGWASWWAPTTSSISRP